MLIGKLLREEKAKFANAVGTIRDRNEREMLPVMVESLAEWVGKHLWIYGYDVEAFEFFCKDFDYGRKLEIAAEIDLQRIPLTVRQFCYEFASLADALKVENDKLRSFWFYRLCRSVRGLWAKILGK